jgi:hypothetical protein
MSIFQVRLPGGSLGELRGETTGGLLGVPPGADDEGVTIGEAEPLPPVNDLVGAFGVGGDVGETGSDLMASWLLNAGWCSWMNVLPGSSCGPLFEPALTLCVSYAGGDEAGPMGHINP